MTSIFFCFDETESGSVAPKALWTAAGSPMNAVPKSQQEESVLDVLTPDAELPASMAFCCKTGDEEGEAAPTARRLKQKSLRDEAFDLYRKCVATELRELELEGVVEPDRLDELLKLDAYSREHLAPLSSAVKFGATAVLRVLILFGADLRCKNGQSFRRCSRRSATSRRPSRSSPALRARGELCDVAADKGNGYTVLHFAAINNNAGLLLSLNGPGAGASATKGLFGRRSSSSPAPAPPSPAAAKKKKKKSKKSKAQSSQWMGPDTLGWHLPFSMSMFHHSW
ncbi:spectrin binding protein [Aureococcus anophagefferens]|uniref:Spectrin binding protein n=1 Tax=Aureococcus anophagefferens TaxID=44056 RepID=A0ABR1FWK2_AURAN